MTRIARTIAALAVALLLSSGIAATALATGPAPDQVEITATVDAVLEITIANNTLTFDDVSWSAGDCVVAGSMVSNALAAEAAVVTVRSTETWSADIKGAVSTDVNIDVDMVNYAETSAGACNGTALLTTDAAWADSPAGTATDADGVDTDQYFALHVPNGFTDGSPVFTVTYTISADPGD